MKKIDLAIYHNPVNRFSVAYLLYILEKEKLADHFALHYFDAPDALEKVLETTRGEERPRVFMFSFMTSILDSVIANMDALKLAAAEDKGVLKNSLVIAGGPHATGDAESAVSLGFDLVFKGEGEYSWPDFLRRAVEYRAAEDFREKITAHYSSAIVADPRPVSLDMYQPFGTLYSLTPPLEIMRGCFYNCRFCQTATCEIKYRSLESAEEYFAEYRRRRYKRLSFICPSAFHYSAKSPGSLNTSAIEAMLESASVKYGIGYIEYGIFPSESRPETITDETAALVKKYCRNKRLSVGAQSGDAGRIKELRRGHGLDAVRAACETLRRHGLTAVVDFIFGFPDETEEEQMATLAAAKELHTRFGSHIQTHYFIPLPGTPLYRARPSSLTPKAVKILEKYSAGGICNNWYREGLGQSQRVCAILDRLQNS